MINSKSLRAFILLFALVSILTTNFAYSKIGDTLKVRTITYDSLTRQAGWFDFPDTLDGKRFERILLNYKLRMPNGKPGVAGISEWDYDKYLYVVQYYALDFTVNYNQKYDSLSYIKSPSWKYTAKIDTNTNQLVVDSTQNKPYQIDYFNDTENLTKSTKRLFVWAPYWRYTFKMEDSMGVKKAVKDDSTYISADTTIYLQRQTRVYYKDSCTWGDKYEIFRYITLYGTGLDLGDGLTWNADVSDFRKLLSGKVYLESYLLTPWDNPPKLMYEQDLSFDFIEGIPPRDLVDCRRVYNSFDAVYNKNMESRFLPPKNIFINSSEKTSRLKIIQTGHGANDEGCAEFCKKYATLKINGEQKYELPIWRNCGINPIFPQSGTWIYDRTNWCPGAEVQFIDLELTPYVTINSANTIDYNMEYVDYSDAGGATWRIRAYLCTYGDINHKNDACIEDIISPSDKMSYMRQNPNSTYPAIIIKNAGSDNLTSLNIEYGIKGGKKYQYTWNGNLAFLETANVKLPPIELSEWNTNSNNFEVVISNPNGKVDEYDNNNKAYSKFQKTLKLPSNVVLELTTNNYETYKLYYPSLQGQDLSSLYKYSFTKADGETLKQFDYSEEKKTYRDTLTLSDGAYNLTLSNELGFGLGWWVFQRQSNEAYNVKNGSFRILSGGKEIYRMPTDFGPYYSIDFRVGGDLPSYALDKDTIDFGEVEIGSAKEMDFKIKLNNKEPLFLKNISLSLNTYLHADTNKGFYINKISPTPYSYTAYIDNEDSCTVTVRFAPNKKAGSFKSNVYFTSNSYTQQRDTVVIKGVAIQKNNVEENVNIDEQNDLFLNVYQNITQASCKIIWSVYNTNSNAELALYDVLGKKIETIFDGIQNDNYNEIDFDISKFPNGQYYLVLKSNGLIKTEPISVVK